MSCTLNNFSRKNNRSRSTKVTKVNREVLNLSLRQCASTDYLILFMISYVLAPRYFYKPSITNKIDLS